MKIRGSLKGLLLLILPYSCLGWLRRPLLLVTNMLSLSSWVSRQKGSASFNDFYSFSRDYAKRCQLYRHIIDTFDLGNREITYLEFGVYKGSSFNWWLHHCGHPDSRFYGFDTFEGLPEDWGSTYSRGDMLADMPDISDPRGSFIKGLFQQTLPGFLQDFHPAMKAGRRKIIHLDADLFSSTLFVLTSLAPYLSKGDILMFDEFNVPNHEAYAFRIFSEAYYIKTRLVGAVNNYFQVALMIE